MSLSINVLKKGEPVYYEVTPVGEIDIYTSPDFKKKLLELLEEEKLDFVINGENLEYLDSTGLGALISFFKSTKDVNVSIKLINLKPNIYKLFDITGLNDVFNIE